MYDIIIVGGGPAGLTSAIYAQRNGKSSLIIEKNGFGGQMTHSPKIENYPGFESISGNEIADKMLDQAIKLGAEIEYDNVTNIENKDTYKIVNTESGAQFETKTVILATGVKHRIPTLPHINDFIGNGISFCAVCDGDFYTDKTVCVIGGGNSALQEAILLTEKCKKVTIIQDLPYLTGEQTLINILKNKNNVEIYTNTKLDELIIKNNELSGIKFTDTTDNTEYRIACDGIFVAIGLIPENIAFKNLVSLDGNGYFYTDENCTSETPGIYVAGDCRSKRIRQITTATADGATAALAACRYIDTL
jgi:thioredoxin reductase (NADPH)